MGDMEELADRRVGFQRKEMFSEPLAGTVELYDIHVFLITGDGEQPDQWAPKLEKVEGPLATFKSAIKAVEDKIKGAVKITLCCPASDKDKEGDLLIYPQALRYRAGNFDAATCKALVDAAILNINAESIPCLPIKGTNVFVCCHAKRDARCGVCGPKLVSAFKMAAAQLGAAAVSVRASSHVGGHKYAGVLVLFTSKGEGFWYGYASPSDASQILESHINNSKVISRLWRGQLGMTADEHRNIVQQLQGSGCAACSTQSDGKFLEAENSKKENDITAAPQSSLKWEEVALMSTAVAALAVLLVAAYRMRY
mmetsp:Transcript_1414/g.2934  ORF Transcript_1414/g.2934 Transcript_1414/m.2934 type:complete len:311 (-) Transcript_1414:283-1215(-)